MDELEVFFCYLRSKESFYQNDTLYQFLSLFPGYNYRLISGTSEHDDYYSDWLSLQYGQFKGAAEQRAHLLTAEISQNLQQEIAAFLDKKQDALRVDAYPVSIGFELHVSLHANGSGIEFTALGEKDLYVNEEGLENYQTLLKILKETYALWHSPYIFQVSGEEGKGNANFDVKRLDDSEITWLYDINIYGPELVAKIGREKLLSAPAWIVEELEDGGMLLVPEEHISLTTVHRLEEVAQHLGLKPHLSSEDEDDDGPDFSGWES